MNSDYAKTAREQLEKWDKGKSIWTIEMGGIGPGYEQAIQVLAIEIVRDEIDNPLPGDGEFRTWAEATVSRVDAKDETGKYSYGGFSGGQVGAAKQLAYHWLAFGPAALLEKPEVQDRKIQASNFWPRVPERKKF